MSPNERRIKKWERECVRAGHHIPWVKVGSFSSTGMQHRIRGLDDGVVSHLHSNGEEALYTRLVFRGGYDRLRTQVPLYPLAHVRNLAKLAGVRMPRDRDHQDWAVLSTDVVVDRTVRGRKIVDAYWVKPQAVIDGRHKASVENNFRIEQAFWRHLGARLHRVISETMDAQETKNIGHLLDELNLNPSKASIAQKASFSKVFLRLWDRDLNLSELLRLVERKQRIARKDAWSLFAASVRAGLLPIDLREELDDDLPVFLKELP